MLVRFLVVIYLSAYFLAGAVARASGEGMVKYAFLVPFATYVLWRVALWATYRARKGGAGSPPARVSGLSALILLYTVAYGLLYFPRAQNTNEALGSFATLVVHALFWHFVFHDPTYRARRPLFFRDAVLSCLLASVVGVTVALQVVGWSFQRGQVHNLAGYSPLIRSDFEVPFLAFVAGIAGLTSLFFRMRQRRTGGGRDGVAIPSRMLGMVLVGWSLVILLLYSRRAPLFAMLLILGILLLPRRISRRLGYAALVLPFMPLIWNSVSVVLLSLTQNSLFSALLARNEAADYLTATNRLQMWVASISFLSDFRPKHLIGYGGAPAEVRSAWATNVHNAYIQLALDSGLLVLVLVVGILFLAFRLLSRALIADGNVYHIHALRAVLIGWLMISGVEPAMQSHSIMHMVLIALLLSVANGAGDVVRDAGAAAATRRAAPGRRAPTMLVHGSPGAAFRA